MRRVLRFVLTAVLVVAFLFSIFVFPVVLLLLGVPAILILTDFKHNRDRMVRVFRWFPWVGHDPVKLGGVLLSWSILATVFGLLIYRNGFAQSTAVKPVPSATAQPQALASTSVPIAAPSPRVTPTRALTLVPVVVTALKPNPTATRQPARQVPVHPTSLPVPRPTSRPTARPVRRPTLRPTPRPTPRPVPRPTVKPAPLPASAESAWLKNYSDTLSAITPLGDEMVSASTAGSKGDFTTALSYTNQAETTLAQTRQIWNAGPPPPSGNTLDSALNADLDAAIKHYTSSIDDLHRGLVNQDGPTIMQGVAEAKLANADLHDAMHRMGLG